MTDQEIGCSQATSNVPIIDQLSSGGSASSGDESEKHEALILRFMKVNNPPRNGPWLKVQYGNNEIRELTTLDQLRHHRLLMAKENGEFTAVEKDVITQSSQFLVNSIAKGEIRVIETSNCIMNMFGDKNSGLRVYGGGGVLWVCNSSVDYVGTVRGSFRRGGVEIRTVHCEGARRRSSSNYSRMQNGTWYWLAGVSHPENKTSRSDDIYDDADQTVDDSVVSRSLVLESGSLPIGLIGEQLVEGHIVCVRGNTCLLNAPHVGCRGYCKLSFHVVNGGDCSCITHIPQDVTVIPGDTEVSDYGGQEIILSPVSNPWPAEEHVRRVNLVRRLLKANSLEVPLGWKDLCASTGQTMHSLATFIFDFAASLGAKSGSYIPWTEVKTWRVPRLPVRILSSTCIYVDEDGWVTRAGIPLTVKAPRECQVSTVEASFNVDGCTYAGKAVWSHMVDILT